MYKPNGASALTGRLLVDCLIAGGLPEGVLNLVFGGRECGEALVRNTDIDGYAFTGSNAVGMSILRATAASRASPGEMSRALATAPAATPVFP